MMTFNLVSSPLSFFFGEGGSGAGVLSCSAVLVLCFCVGVQSLFLPVDDVFSLGASGGNMFVVRLFRFPLDLQSAYHTFDGLSGIGSQFLENIHPPYLMP